MTYEQAPRFECITDKNDNPLIEPIINCLKENGLEHNDIMWFCAEPIDDDEKFYQYNANEYIVVRKSNKSDYIAIIIFKES
jgi:hypothetical protein